MAICVLVSAKGSPGVSTCAVALASVWPDPRWTPVIEADPAGGDLVLRCGLNREPGLASLVSDRRGDDIPMVAEHCQRLGVGVDVVGGPVDATEAATAVTLWAQQASSRMGGGAGTVLLVDGGRLAVSSPIWPVVSIADLVLLVLAPRLDAAGHARGAVASLQARRGAQGRVGLVLCGDGPYDPPGVREALGAPVVGVLPRDDRCAAMLSGDIGPARWARTALAKAARRTAECVAGILSARHQDSIGDVHNGFSSEWLVPPRPPPERRPNAGVMVGAPGRVERRERT